MPRKPDTIETVRKKLKAAQESARRADSDAAKYYKENEELRRQCKVAATREDELRGLLDQKEDQLRELEARFTTMEDEYHAFATLIARARIKHGTIE